MTKEKTKTIGLGIECPPKGDITPDKNCPFYGPLRVRGNVFKGEVVSTHTHLTAAIRIVRQVYLAKYKRYKKKVSKIQVHNPAVLNAKAGDIVEFMGCRPLSKTKSMVITKIISRKTE